MKDKYKQFITETGQWLRFTSWQYHKKLDAQAERKVK